MSNFIKWIISIAGNPPKNANGEHVKMQEVCRKCVHLTSLHWKHKLLLQGCCLWSWDTLSIYRDALSASPWGSTGILDPKSYQSLMVPLALFLWFLLLEKTVSWGNACLCAHWSHSFWFCFKKGKKNYPCTHWGERDKCFVGRFSKELLRGIW